MKYKITYRWYRDLGGTRLAESLSTCEVQAFMFENGFVSIWTEHNETQIPDFYVNANNVLTIKSIGDEQ